MTITTIMDYPEPRIIARPDHPISRKNIDREALKVLYRLRDAGFTAYLVGGGVRDLYLGKKPKDYDISTNARPGQLRKLFKNSRVIGRRFRLVQVFFKGGKVIEISTFRCRSEYDLNGSNSEVLPSNNTFGSQAEDAFRRDLTINALFYGIENFSVIDYTGGVEDLLNGITRIVGDPNRRITRDPVRMMRVIRHAARAGFTIEEKTWQAILDNNQMLSLCPVSRIRDELFKDLYGGATCAWAEFAIQSNLFFNIFPFYKDIIEKKELKTLFFNLLSIADRFHADNHRLPEAILLAMILLPWAIEEMELLTPRRGGEFFQYSRSLRSKLDELLVHLNIKRADKEAITGLLANLPTFIQSSSKGKWPKRLQRKSYFKQGKYFYRIYKEATGGPVVSNIKLAATKKPMRRKKPGHSRNRNPAFSKKSKKGVFGLKK